MMYTGLFGRLANIFRQDPHSQPGQKVTRSQRRHYAVTGKYTNRGAFSSDFRRVHLQRIKHARARG